jgi:hypothetical protein
VTTLAQALAQPGNRIVEVNAHHNSQFVGNVNTNPVTTGLYQGYLIVKAQGCDPENGIYPWNIDARTVRFHLQGSTRRLIFWGFNVLGEIDDDGADVWWWYCKLSHPADRATLPSWSSPLYQSPDCLDLTDAVRPRVHGCTFSDWAHAIQGGATTLDSRGCEFFNPYNSVASKWNTHALFVPNGGLSGSLTDFFVDDRYPHASYTLDNNTGRGLELVGDPASKGAIDLTLSRGWVKSSFGDAVTLSGDPSAATTRSTRTRSAATRRPRRRWGRRRRRRRGAPRTRRSRSSTSRSVSARSTTTSARSRGASTGRSAPTATRRRGG